MKIIHWFTALSLTGVSLASAESVPGASLFPKVVEVGETGPWGTLESYKVRLSCPSDYLGAFSIPSEMTSWVLPQVDTAELKELLFNAGLTSDQINYLLTDHQVIQGDGSLRFFPSPTVVLGMSQNMRSTLYRFLSRYPENTFHRRPAFLNTSNVTRYFLDSNLQDDTLEKIALLAYPSPSGYGYFLSDVPFLMRNIESTEAERNILNALLRVPALVVRLHLNGESSVDDLASYWNAGFKNKQIRPLIESVIANPQVDRLDACHLLPPHARQNLNRFPNQSDALGGRYPDWFWTCYNFFRFNPIDVYADSKDFVSLFESEFLSVPRAPYQFGDLIVLKSQEEIVHGAIYIADNIVYTKNGSSPVSPTIFMKLRDLVAYHDLTGDIVLQHYRNKSASRSTLETR